VGKAVVPLLVGTGKGVRDSILEVTGLVGKSVEVLPVGTEE